MESLPKEKTISQKEQGLKSMKLSQSRKQIKNLTVMDDIERKNLWEKWKTDYPNSNKIWRMSNKQQAHSLRCQAPVVIKKFQS